MDSDGRMIRKADLIEPKSVSFYQSSNDGGNTIVLLFTKNFVESQFLEGQNVSKFKAYDIRIRLCTERDDSNACLENLWNEQDAFVQRVLKAFEHLAYLANEKRKESKF